MFSGREVEFVEVAVVTADENSLADDDWRAIDLAVRCELPDELAGRAVDRVNMIVAAADNDQLVGHGRRRPERRFLLLGQVPPDDGARLPIHRSHSIAEAAEINDVPDHCR